MNIIPYHRFQVHSPLTPEHALELLSDQTDADEWLQTFRPRAASRFRGQTREGGFVVSRLKRGYRNSFEALAHGTVTAASPGCDIAVVMRQRLFVIAFSVVYLMLAIPAAFASNTDILGDLLLISFYAFSMWGFWADAMRIEAMLKQVFQCDPTRL